MGVVFYSLLSFECSLLGVECSLLSVECSLLGVAVVCSFLSVVWFLWDMT